MFLGQIYQPLNQDNHRIADFSSSNRIVSCLTGSDVCEGYIKGLLIEGERKHQLYLMPQLEMLRAQVHVARALSFEPLQE